MSRRPHVVHIVGTMGMGGAQRQVIELIKSPQLTGFKHSIVCAIAREGDFLQAAYDLGVEVHECQIRWPKHTPIPSYRFNRWLRRHLEFSFSRRLSLVLADIDADVVHSQLTASMKWQAKAILHYARIPWVWTIHGLYKSRGEDISQWNDALARIAISEASMITGVSRAALKELDGLTPVPASKLHVIYNGIQLSKYALSHADRVNARRQWRIPQDALVFGSAGRLIDVKRFDLAIDAFAKIVLENADAHFVLAGDGPLDSGLRARAAAQGVSEHFHFIGYQNDMNSFLNSIDVFVLCSDSEGMPNVILEAMALSRPCISTAVGGVPEVLGDAGILIEPNSVDALVTAMQSMLSAQQRAICAEKSRVIVEKFDLTNTAAQYGALYDELLNRQCELKSSGITE